MIIPNSLGPQLMAARIEYGVTRAEIADLLCLSPTQIGRMETGANSLRGRSARELVDWARAAAIVVIAFALMADESGER